MQTAEVKATAQRSKKVASVRDERTETIRQCRTKGELIRCASPQRRKAPQVFYHPGEKRSKTAALSHGAASPCGEWAVLTVHNRGSYVFGIGVYVPTSAEGGAR